MFIHFRDRKQQSMNGGRSEREGDTESETGSRLRAVSTEPDAGLLLSLLLLSPKNLQAGVSVFHGLFSTTLSDK